MASNILKLTKTHLTRKRAAHYVSKPWDFAVERDYTRHAWPGAEAVVQVVFRALTVLLNFGPFILYLIVRGTLFEWPKVTMMSVCTPVKLRRTSAPLLLPFGSHYHSTHASPHN